MGAEVFISYSSLDRDRVMPVVESLRGNGISVWVDEGNIHAADLWSEQIVQAIADCHVMVVMLSQNSTDSHNVVKEVMLASEQKKALLPVYLEPAEVPAKLQYQLAGIQHLELYGQDEHQVLEEHAGIQKITAFGTGRQMQDHVYRRAEEGEILPSMRLARGHVITGNAFQLKQRIAAGPRAIHPFLWLRLQ